MENKTHYRRVMKSDHLGIADLEDFIEEGKPLIFIIKEVKQELNTAVAGKKGDFNIAYFKEKIKPLVLNATNAKRIRSFAPNNSPFVEDWANITIELYIDSSVKMKGELVGGVRVKVQQPKLTPKKKESITGDKLQKAIEAIEKGEYSKEQLLGRFELTAEQLKTI